MKLTFSVASPTDAGDLAALVNRAYRPVVALGGWTHEANWIRGPRTTAPKVTDLMNDGSVILTIKDPIGGLIACVQVSSSDATACFGMLATEPALQGIGLGTQMLEAAERYALSSGMPTTARINVLECRSELVSFYERRGYRRTGVVQPYPMADGIGVPVNEGVKVVELAKSIDERVHSPQIRHGNECRIGASASQILTRDFNLQASKS